jgi:Glycosyltransferases involved in cell wall biogenesis
MLDNQVVEPLVSVVIPAFNASRHIEQSIDSVLNQTYANFEIIVVDDGSADDTGDIVRRVMQRDSRIKLHWQKNGGIASARNLAVRNSLGEFIAPLDADDLWLPTYLEKQVACMLKAPQSVAVVYAWSQDIDEDGHLTGQFHASNIEGYVYETLLSHYFLANATSVLIRRAIFEKVGSYNSTFARCEDWNLMARLARKCEFRVVKEFLVLYRKRRESMTQSYDAMALGQEMTLKAAQHADSGIPAFITSISSSLFYGYLAQQSADQNDVDSCLSWILRSIQANPLVSIARVRTYSYLIWCGCMKLSGCKSRATTTQAELAQAIAPKCSSKKSVVYASGGTAESLEKNLSSPPKHALLVKLILQDLLHLAIRLVCGIHFILHNKYKAGTSQILENPALKTTFTYGDKESIEEIIALDDQLPMLASLPQDQSVSVIVPSCDRPDELRHCLSSLIAQNSSRPLEIVVVDNNPSSGLALPIVSEFRSVKFIKEWRQGASFARNAGIAAGTGDICVFIDDDIVAPPDWIERLIAPFANEGIGAVTGNVFPYELDSPTAKLFEGYANGGFNRGFSRWEADSQWFHSHRIGGAKTWLLGGSGNAAIRRKLLMSPEIGVFQTYLGAGVPAGSSEDTYLFYKIIKMGYTVAYEPTAYAWHKHRQNMQALGHQLFNYSKGFVSYHLTTLFRDGDLRSIPSLIHLPWWHIKRTVLRLAGKSSHPVKLIMLEAFGHLIGPFALIQARLRAQKLENLPYSK